MTKYIIPFLYTFYTRTKGNSKKVAYLFTFIIPVFLFAYAMLYKSNISPVTIGVGVIVALIGTMSIYEIGYIRNDVFTIKTEKNPTLRLSKDELTYVEKNITTILIVKYIIAILSVIIIYFLKLEYIQFLIALVLIEIFYFMHNKVRGRLSILSFFILSTLRYITALMIFKGNVLLTIAVFIVAISIPRTFEKASEKKFNIKYLAFMRDGTVELNLVRFLYYIALLINVLAEYMMLHTGIIFIILTLYYLIYRGLIALVIFMKSRRD
ncbi:hypothetical protein [Clostridium mediterraneense]|uniref:hypothetical protein n=1 Tax=Clostridium mediterraneense TaxID=1805472 RepID=UPI000834B4B8|nr:hypothetical protein [Clostridium mediterraneense]